MANSYFNENTLEELIEEIKYVYKSDDRPWVIGYSGGKDSTTVVELVYTQKYEHVPTDKVLKLIDAISRESTSDIRRYVVHLGRRSVKTDGLHIKERYGCSNIDWFRQTYPEDKWINFVSASMKIAKNQVKEKMKASTKRCRICSSRC